MYGIFTYIYHKNQPNVGKYPIPMDPLGEWTNPEFEERAALPIVEFQDLSPCRSAVSAALDFTESSGEEEPIFVACFFL